MSKDLETFLSAVSKKDYRVDFKLPEGSSEVVQPAPVVTPAPVVEPEVIEVVVPAPVVEPEVVVTPEV